MSPSPTVVAFLAAQIFFSKSFPGSSPPYFEIELDESGKGVFRESADDDQPLRFELASKETQEIFGLAEKLRFFQRPLESKAKVANMGLKTLRYQSGDKKTEQKFNYSDEPDARALVDWFERISETEQHLINLERTARFDRMGVNKALLLMEAAWDKNRLVALEQFLPVLDRIASQKNYLHMAQARAAAMAERIRAGKAQNQ
jgi:hypothetical protein